MPAPARTHIALRAAIARLAKFYGPPPRPPATDPFELVIWENCAYLVDDARRAAVFRRLRRAAKLHTAAEIALDIGPAELRRAVQRSSKEAKKLLRRFPGIGEPSADKILLFCRAAMRAHSPRHVRGVSPTRSYLPACLSQRSSSISTAHSSTPSSSSSARTGTRCACTAGTSRRTTSGCRGWAPRCGYSSGRSPTTPPRSRPR